MPTQNYIVITENNKEAKQISWSTVPAADFYPNDFGIWQSS